MSQQRQKLGLYAGEYRIPTELRTSGPFDGKVLVIGSCLSAGFPDVIRSVCPNATVEYLLFNNALNLPALAKKDPLPDFQIVQIPMRSVLPESLYFRLSFSDEDGHRAAFREAEDRLRVLLGASLKYHDELGLLTFVLNFVVPQTNPMGRTFNRYDYRNPVYFFEKLNEQLHEFLNDRKNLTVVDTDAIAATIGKMHVCDDVLWQINHASALSDSDFVLDQNRIAATEKPSTKYGLQTYEFVLAVWAEISALYITHNGIGRVKMVVVDLDDTLWRGVYAEEGARSVEGWPLGMAEALLYLKKRGIVLAIASKNEESVIAGAFDKIFGAARLRLDDFALKRINWLPKAENLRSIIEEANLLPSSVVFVDDNPAERDAISLSFPDIRVLGGDLYANRRILLWSAEAQVPVLTKESADRSEAIKMSVARLDMRKKLTREEFLIGLGVNMTEFRVRSVKHPAFERLDELINKTNQFNTTGERRSYKYYQDLFISGGAIFGYDVEDKFSKYGIVIAALVRGNILEQFVMSCRTFGLELEFEALRSIGDIIRRETNKPIIALYKSTGRNTPCAGLYPQSGFSMREDGHWILDRQLDAACANHICFHRNEGGI